MTELPESDDELLRNARVEYLARDALNNLPADELVAAMRWFADRGEVGGRIIEGSDPPAVEFLGIEERDPGDGSPIELWWGGRPFARIARDVLDADAYFEPMTAVVAQEMAPPSATDPDPGDLG